MSTTDVSNLVHHTHQQRQACQQMNKKASKHLYQEYKLIAHFMGCNYINRFQLSTNRSR